jgi:hypothetical protein
MYTRKKVQKGATWLVLSTLLRILRRLNILPFLHNFLHPIFNNSLPLLLLLFCGRKNTPMLCSLFDKNRAWWCFQSFRQNSDWEYYRLNMMLDIQRLFGLHVHCAQLYSLAETPRHPLPPPHLGLHIRALLVSQDRRLLFVTHGKCTSQTHILNIYRVLFFHSIWLEECYKPFLGFFFAWLG